MSLDDDVNYDASKAGIVSATVYPVGVGADEKNHCVEELD
jgi:hypothetical protein